jgi:septum formation protein
MYNSGDNDNTPRLVLASASPRRRELLSFLGIPFEVIVSGVDETFDPARSPEEAVEYIAHQKGAEVARRSSLPILAADTVIEYKGEIIGKPKDKDHVREMLKRLRNDSHSVLTGVVFMRGGDVLEQFNVATEMVFGDVPDEVIDAYAQSGESLDGAGGYHMQKGGGQFVREVRGSYSNVIGLPLFEVAEILRKHL